jgi:GNAT superfamily N-acetyltransferase
MLRRAVAGDLPALLAIRDRSSADALSDPARANEGLLRRLIDSGTVVVWDDARVAGFAATDGAAIHLLVDSARRGGGIERALLDWARDAVRDAGHVAAVITLAPGSTAERHYRAAGWVEAGGDRTREVILKKPS